MFCSTPSHYDKKKPQTRQCHSTVAYTEERFILQPLWWHRNTLWGTFYHRSYPHILPQEQWIPLTCKLDPKIVPAAKGCAKCHGNKRSKVKGHIMSSALLCIWWPRTAFLEPLFLSIGADHPEISAPLHLPMVMQPCLFGSHIWTAKEPQVLTSFCTIYSTD